MNPTRDEIRELIREEFLDSVAQFATAQESLKPQSGMIKISGKEYKYVFPSLFVVRECIKLGFPPLSFNGIWDKAEKDDKEFELFVKNWPTFVHVIIDSESGDIDDLHKITYGEAQSIHLGFSNLAWEVRRNSKAG